MEKHTRYITTIFTLDRNTIYGLTRNDNDDIKDYMDEEEKHYGLKMISTKEEIKMIIEYTNIIWNYRFYYGTHKKKYKPLSKNDERWENIEKRILSDLKTMGLENLKDEVLQHLKKQQYYEYKNKKEEQFKKYYISD